MDPLELSYDTQEAVPEAFRELYVENDGKFTISNINGLKTTTDTDTLQEALRKERGDHKAVADLFKPWKDMKHDEVVTKLDRIKELELAADGKIDDDKINQMVESRIGQKTSPLERKIDSLNGDVTSITAERDGLKAQIQRRDLNDQVRAIATEMKVINTAIPDVEMVAHNYLERNEDGKWIVRATVQDVTPGMDIKGFMKEMQRLRPHWWPASEGGGANGGGSGGGFGGTNPFAEATWNMTNQGNIIKEQGREIADRMAKAAGTTVGGLRPQKKG